MLEKGPVFFCIEGNAVVCTQYGNRVHGAYILVGTNGFIQGIVAVFVSLTLAALLFWVNDVFKEIVRACALHRIRIEFLENMAGI